MLYNSSVCIHVLYQNNNDHILFIKKIKKIIIIIIYPHFLQKEIQPFPKRAQTIKKLLLFNKMKNMQWKTN